MPLIQKLYHSDFKSTLLLAQQLHRQDGEALLGLPLIRQGLDGMEQKAGMLQDQMAGMDLAPLCTQCSLKSGGGCCSLFMADENDAVLLLINLLAGYPVAIQKDDGHECYLLGPLGCILRFKPMFCLNYNCQAIKMRTAAALLSSYLAMSAQLLQSQWQVESLILAYLKGCSRSLTEQGLAKKHTGTCSTRRP